MLFRPRKPTIPPLQRLPARIVPLRTRQNQHGLVQSFQSMLQHGTVFKSQARSKISKAFHPCFEANSTSRRKSVIDRSKESVEMLSQTSTQSNSW